MCLVLDKIHGITKIDLPPPVICKRIQKMTLKG